MTQRIRRISVDQSDTEQSQDLPVQVHDRQLTYPSLEGELEHLERQVQQWKAKFTHLQTHLEKFEQFKEKYDKLIKRNRQLENSQRQKQFQIEDLNKKLQMKAEELLQVQRKKKLQFDQVIRQYKVQVQNLKQQIQQYQSKISSFETEQRKKKRNLERQLNKIKEQLHYANQQLSLNQQITNRYKGQNIVLKNKIQDIQVMKQIPLQRNYHLTSQVQTLTIQINLKDNQILSSKQIINQLQKSLRLESQKNKTLTKQIQSLRIQHQSKVRKINIEYDRLKVKQVQYYQFQYQFTKQKQQLQSKNQQIDNLLKKIDTSCKASVRSHRNSDNEQYYNELSKLQQDIYKKHTEHKKQKQILQQRLIQLQNEFNMKMAEKNKIIEQQSLIILSINNDFEHSKRNEQYVLHDFQQENIKHKQTILLLKRKLQVCEVNLEDLKILTVKMEDKVTLLQNQNQRLYSDNKILERRHSQMLIQFQQHIRNNRYKQNYENNTNRMEVQQLYQAKLSSKDQLIQLLRLKLKNIESADSMNRTGGGTFYY